MVSSVRIRSCTELSDPSRVCMLVSVQPCCYQSAGLCLTDTGVQADPAEACRRYPDGRSWGVCLFSDSCRTTAVPAAADFAAAVPVPAVADSAVQAVPAAAAVAV